MSREWRLIVDGRVDGERNMALDRAIQLLVEQGESPPTLRLYQWTRPTVTLGRFQDSAGVDVRACDELGIDVVRRFTGGRGVLHDDELTYSVVASMKDGVPRGVAASYRYLCEPLAAAYRLLGVDAAVTAHDRTASGSAACYLATTRADLSLGASKLSGSAQVWTGETVLQHGSFTRTRDAEREARVFMLTAEDERRLAGSTATLDDVLDRRVPMDELRANVVKAFELTMGIEFVLGEATQQEQNRARQLEAEVQVCR